MRGEEKQFVPVHQLLEVRESHDARRLDPVATALVTGLSPEALDRVRETRPSVLGLADIKEPSPDADTTEF